MRSGSVLYTLVVGWIGVLSYRLIMDPPYHGAANWISAILLWALSLGLIFFAGARAILYFRERMQVKRAGGAFFTKSFLIRGWLVTVVYAFLAARLDEEVIRWSGAALFLGFTLALAVFLVRERWPMGRSPGAR